MFKTMIGTSNHGIRVEHWTDWLEDCPESTKHVLRVSVEFTNVWGHATRVSSEAWIDHRLLTCGILFDTVVAWKEDQVPKLAAKVLGELYEQKRKGTVQNGDN